jgi:hypothetical protein
MNLPAKQKAARFWRLVRILCCNSLQIERDPFSASELS